MYGRTAFLNFLPRMKNDIISGEAREMGRTIMPGEDPVNVLKGRTVSKDEIKAMSTYVEASVNTPDVTERFDKEILDEPIEMNIDGTSQGKAKQLIKSDEHLSSTPDYIIPPQQINSNQMPSWVDNNKPI